MIEPIGVRPLSLWCMAVVMSDLQLPSKPYSMTSPGLVN